MVAARTTAVAGFNCRSCGAAVERRALTHTRAVACTSCGALLDPNDPNVVIQQQAQLRERIVPAIPLGTRGTFDGHPFDVVGFQYRTIDVDGTTYGWREYVLFNPYQGFRYLSEYDGHWNFIRPLPNWPAEPQGGTIHGTWDDASYRHFQTADATTRFVLGEFPWRVRVGDRVSVSDFVAPPRLLSRERTKDETTWSVGRYMTGAEVWTACGLSTSPPDVKGIFANQPSPYQGKVMATWRRGLMLAGLVVLLLVGREITASREQVFTGSFVSQPTPGATPTGLAAPIPGQPPAATPGASFATTDAAEPAFVTDTFTLRDGGTLELDVATDLTNAWLALDFALVNLATGTAVNVDTEIERYAGTDADGPWSEGSTSGRLLVPYVPAGEYYLRVEPAGNAPTHYTLTVRRDVVSELPYFLALGALCVWPIFVAVRAASFESRRWQESDSESGGGDDDDD